MYAQSVAPSPYASAPSAPSSSVVKVQSEWSSGLCSCMEDFNVCCYVFFCSGCVTMNSMKVVNGQIPTCCDNCMGTGLSVLSYYWLGILCHGFIHMRMRNDFAKQMNIRDENTCLRSFCCLWCSACQIEREINSRNKLQVIPQPAMIH